MEKRKEYMNNPELSIIAGPCAAESRHQMVVSAQEALKRNIDTVRMSLWKPRTKPGFEGIGTKGIPILLEVAQMGVRPATEVLLPEHAEAAMEGILGKDGNTTLLLWLGSRNQNHTIQHDIGNIIAGESRVSLMIKNQMWKDPNHWEGIVEHVLSGGARAQQLILCHRGFAPMVNGLRNPPDLDMALRVKQKISEKLNLDIPMIADPSHIAGRSAENVIDVAIDIARHRSTIDGKSMRVDGLIVEVHPHPDEALTDKNQQLRWSELDVLLQQLAREVTV